MTGRGEAIGSLAGSRSGLPKANGLEPPVLAGSSPRPLEPLALWLALWRESLGEEDLGLLCI